MMKQFIQRKKIQYQNLWENYEQSLLKTDEIPIRKKKKHFKFKEKETYKQQNHDN